jgi:hypothetical protein
MSALRIFSRFAELLDVKITRAAAAWLRLNADGTVSERTAAQTLGDLGAYPAASISGASVSYASTAGSADTATSATSAGSADTANSANSANQAAALAFGSGTQLVSIAMDSYDVAVIHLGSAAGAAIRTAGNMAADYVAPRNEAGNVTLALTDHRVPIRLTATSGTSTITINVDGTTAYPAGFVVMFKRHGAGALAFSISGVTVNNNFLSAVAVGGWFALQKTATASTWDMI